MYRQESPHQFSVVSSHIRLSPGMSSANETAGGLCTSFAVKMSVWPFPSTRERDWGCGSCELSGSDDSEENDEGGSVGGGCELEGRPCGGGGDSWGKAVVYGVMGVEVARLQSTI